jgi:uncharacterized Zn-finger protein
MKNTISCGYCFKLSIIELEEEEDIIEFCPYCGELQDEGDIGELETDE